MFPLDTRAIPDTGNIRYNLLKIGIHMLSPDKNQPWCPGQSLWNLITDHVSGSELPKIRTALGHSLVDMYTDVHAEAEMWHRLWQESQRGGNHGSGAGTPFPRPKGSPLADPPAVKELLRAEVKMLLQTLGERASRGGRDGQELLHRYNLETVNYALGHVDRCYSSCTNPEDTDNGSRPSSHCSVQSSTEDEFEAVRDKLNVTEIDQVVNLLRSVLIEECEALSRLLKHLKGNVKQKCQGSCEYDKVEPSLAELRKLRGTIQMDLELYPSSFAASSPPPAKEIKNSFKLSAGQSPETPLDSTSMSVLRPHPPPPPLCHPRPRPPDEPPVTKTSLSRTHGQHRISSASNKSSKTPTCNRTDASGQKMVKSENPCSFSPERDTSRLHRKTPTPNPSFHTKSERNSPIPKSHLSSHHGTYSPSAECNLSPQKERKSSPAWRSRNINITPSPPPALSRLGDAGSHSSNSTDQFVSTARKSRTQSEQQNGSSRGGCLKSTIVGTDTERRMNTSVNSVKETGSLLVPQDIRKSSSETEKDVNKQQNLSGHCVTDYSSRRPENSDTLEKVASTQPQLARIRGQFFTSPRKPQEGTTGQPKSIRDTQTKPQVANRFRQPLPPARVPT